MRKFIAGFLGVASLFVASTVFAVGTPTVRFHQIDVGTLRVGTPTVTDVSKLPAMTDNAGSKLDSGALTITQGSQTVTTSLTACDRVFTEISGYGSTSVFWVTTTSGADFTIQGWYGTTTIVKYIGTSSGFWLAIDE